MTLIPVDVFIVSCLRTAKEYHFPNIDGFHFFKDSSGLSPFSAAAVASSPPAVVTPPLVHELQVNALSRTKAVYEFLLLHQRLNHLNYQTLKNLISQGFIKNFRGNINLVDLLLLRKCIICGIWKMHATHLESENPPVLYKRPGARFDADFKTFKITFFGKVNTVVVLVDAYSKKSYSYWLYYPTEATPNLFLEKVFKTFYAEICLPNQWLHFVFHPDNARTFLSGAMISFCKDHSIVIDPSVKYKSQSNGNAESKLKVLTNAAMCNLAASGLHRTTFPFAWKHAEAVNNDLGTAPDYLSPNFKTDGSECLADNHHTYGSRCFILQHAVNKPSTNLQPSGHCGRWVGNERNHLTKHHVLDEVTGVISQYGTWRY